MKRSTVSVVMTTEVHVQPRSNPLLNPHGLQLCASACASATVQTLQAPAFGRGDSVGLEEQRALGLGSGVLRGVNSRLAQGLVETIVTLWQRDLLWIHLHGAPARRSSSPSTGTSITPTCRVNIFVRLDLGGLGLRCLLTGGLVSECKQFAHDPH